MGLKDIRSFLHPKHISPEITAIKLAMQASGAVADPTQSPDVLETRLADVMRKLRETEGQTENPAELTPADRDNLRAQQDQMIGLKKVIEQKKYNRPSLLTDDQAALTEKEDPAGEESVSFSEDRAGQALSKEEGSASQFPDSAASAGGEIGAQKEAELIKEATYIRFDYSQGAFLEGSVVRRLTTNILLMKDVRIRTPLGTETFSRYILIIGQPIRTTGATGMISDSPETQYGATSSQKARV